MAAHFAGKEGLLLTAHLTGAGRGGLGSALFVRRRGCFLHRMLGGGASGSAFFGGMGGGAFGSACLAGKKGVLLAAV